MAIKIGVEYHNVKEFNKIQRTTEAIRGQVVANRVFFTNCYLHIVSYSNVWGKDVDVCLGMPHKRTLEDGVNLLVLGMMENIIL